MLKTLTTTVSTFSKPPLAPLNIADTYSFNSSNNIPFRKNNNLNATANQCQALYQPHTATNLGPFAILPSSSFTVDPINPSFVKTRNYTSPFCYNEQIGEKF